jgi:superfamily II DNA or RNA helicase
MKEYYKLRYYQKEAVNAALKGFTEWDKQLLVMPTGAGKTICFSALAEQMLPERTLVLADKEKLVEQACEKIEDSIGIIAGREQANHQADRNNAIVVGSVQSMINRLDKWPKNHFKTVICDEAQHAISDSWQSVLNHFDSHANVVGVTATPFRGDKRELGTYFDEVTYEISLRQLIHDGYLAPIILKALPIDIDISEVNSVAGDFHTGRLHDTLTPYLRRIAMAIKEHAKGRKILAFLPLIETSKEFADICNKIGLRAHHISSQEKEKHHLLKHFSHVDGELMSNAMLLTEGYDNPKIDCVVNLRPTRSTALYCQMIGRGTRTAEGKDNLLVLDFLWNHERHDLVRPANIMTESKEVADIMTARSLGGGEHDMNNLERDAVDERRRTLEARIRQNRQRKARTIDPTEISLVFGDLGAAEYEPTMAWHHDPVSTKQRKMLAGQKIDLESVQDKGHASKIIGMLMPRLTQRLATPPQVLLLKKLRHPAPTKATFDEAKQYISRMFNR